MPWVVASDWSGVGLDLAVDRIVVVETSVQAAQIGLWQVELDTLPIR